MGNKIVRVSVLMYAYVYWNPSQWAGPCQMIAEIEPLLTRFPTFTRERKRERERVCGALWDQSANFHKDMLQWNMERHVHIWLLSLPDDVSLRIASLFSPFGNWSKSKVGFIVIIYIYIYIYSWFRFEFNFYWWIYAYLFSFSPFS